jgi:hypothetical protein
MLKKMLKKKPLAPNAELILSKMLEIPVNVILDGSQHGLKILIVAMFNVTKMVLKQQQVENVLVKLISSEKNVMSLVLGLIIKMLMLKKVMLMKKPYVNVKLISLTLQEYAQPVSDLNLLIPKFVNVIPI